MAQDPLTVASNEPLLVVLRDRAARASVSAALEEAGLDATFEDDAAAAVDWLHDHTPSIAVLDFVGAAAPGPSVLAVIRSGEESAPRERVTTIAVVDDDDAAIVKALESGADDFMRRPLREMGVLARIRQKLRHRETRAELARRAEGAKVVLELTQALSSTQDLRSILFTVVQRIAEVARVDRCSIVLVQEGSGRGFVVAASDNRDVYDLPIDVTLYPEIQNVLSSREELVIDDASSHPLFELVSGGASPGGFRSLALLPLVLEERAMGVLFLRGRRPTTFREHEMFLARTIANATAIALRNAHTLTSLRAESQAQSVARLAAERRLSTVQKYFDFFHAAADGLLVLDAGGRVLFANKRAAEITCRAPDELSQTVFRDLFDPKEHAAIDEIYAGFAAGRFPQMVDLCVRRSFETMCDVCVLQVSFSGALWHDTGVVLVSFRDVTNDRDTAVELRKTKEFLERVIDSSADAIVAADTSGNITLFSRAAERLYGYKADEVVGKMNARDLYPPGVARQVKKLMGSAQHGRAGRLEGYRTEAVGSGGTMVPVLVSAASIVENGTEVGSVGVFTDLRDRLRMERELTEAQEELRTREKQAFIADLAGATAHELNQPLTSVSGYAQLLLRRLPPSSPLAKDLRVIVAETERMADIVRKIGKITRYETKSYVGAAKIVDLDRASSDEGPTIARPPSKPPPGSSEGQGPASRQRP
ncbi:MAG: PAS domain S-box protein [Polyangiaceae bacterium]